MNRLLRTSAIRLSLRYSLFYMMIAGAGLATLYWAASRYVDAQIHAGMLHQLSTLKEVYQRGGVTALQEALGSRSIIAESENHRFTLLVAADGTVLAGDLKGWPPAAKYDDKVRNIWIEDSLIPNRMEDHDGYWPSVATRFPDGSRLLIVQSIRQAEDLQEFILSTLFITLALIIGLTLVLGWRMGRQLLARIDQVNQTASKIHQGNLDQRVPVSGTGDEFDELAENLNAMLEHINRLIKGMRQVTDNVAHDLRRPLTRLRNRLDVTLLEPRDNQEYRQALVDIREDIAEVLKTFNALLEIAQAESGQFRGEMGVLDLSGLATELGDIYADPFDEMGQSLLVSVESDVCIHGNRQLLAQLMSNLLENAHKYAGNGARIELQVRHVDDSVELQVSDNGPGIPQDKFSEVLKRYVRLDNARSTAGNGLGLSLVNAITKLHGGSLNLLDNGPGLQVILLYPSVPCTNSKQS
jgi:signal transduction histidine kinase